MQKDGLKAMKRKKHQGREKEASNKDLSLDPCITGLQALSNHCAQDTQVTDL